MLISSCGCDCDCDDLTFWYYFLLLHTPYYAHWEVTVQCCAPILLQQRLFDHTSHPTPFPPPAFSARYLSDYVHSSIRAIFPTRDELKCEISSNGFLIQINVPMFVIVRSSNPSIACNVYKQHSSAYCIRLILDWPNASQMDQLHYIILTTIIIISATTCGSFPAACATFNSHWRNEAKHFRIIAEARS